MKKTIKLQQNDKRVGGCPWRALFPEILDQHANRYRGIDAHAWMRHTHTHIRTHEEDNKQISDLKHIITLLENVKNINLYYRITS